MDIGLPASTFTAQETASLVPRPDAADSLPPVQSGLFSQLGALIGGIQPQADKQEDAGLFSSLFAFLMPDQPQQQPTADGVLGYTVRLSQEQLAHLSLAEGLLLMDASKEDDENTTLVEMGSFQNVAVNWQTGDVVSMFDYTLPVLDNQVVVLYDLIVTDSVRRSIIPVLRNGESGYLLVTRTPANPKWVIVGFSTGYNENGMPMRGAQRIQPGDVIVPLYPAYLIGDDEKDMEDFEVEGDPITVGAGGLTLSFESLLGEEDEEPLVYYYAFLFTDIYGETDMSDFIAIEL